MGHGYSLVELVFAAGLVATLASVAVARIDMALDELRTAGAARYVATRLQQVRTEALARNADAALRVRADGSSFIYAVYVDGNRNGVRSLDIQRGIDRRASREERLRDQFPGVDFGTTPGLPPVDASSGPPGSDPIRLGAADAATFTAEGTATTGSVYIRGPRNAQYVIRIFGETGKTRILKFDARTRLWKSL